MENLSIKVSKKTRECNPNRIYIGNDGENLQSKIIFSFEDEFVDGQARIDTTLEIEGQNPYILLEKVGETYVLPIKSGLTKYNGCKAQLVITESNTIDGIPIFKSKEMKLIVDSSINAVIEQPEEYPDWLELANAKLDEIDESILETDNLDIDASKTGTTATVTITKKDGTEKSVLIKDGDKGDTGNPGRDGVDGYSPTASVSKSGNTATISITDKNGTTTATISDGQNGTNGQDGQNGITPTIGDNGNWYLGSTDTGKPSRGIQGETGASGADGRDGYVQYTAGDNITILNNVISATGGDKFYLGNASDYTQQNPLDLDELPLGEYILGIDNFSVASNYSFYIKYTYENTEIVANIFYNMSGYVPMNKFITFNYLRKGETAPFYIGTFTYLGMKERLEIYLYEKSIKVENNSISTNVGTYYQIKCVNTNTAQDITGEKTFYTIPKQSDTTAPTLNTQFTNKKYVDDKIGDINTILATLTTPGGE